MRRNRKKAVAIGLTSMVVAAGIVVPLVLIYPKAERIGPANFIVIDLTGEPGLTMPWGNDPKGLSAPTLPDKYSKPGDHDGGVFEEVGPDATKDPGDSGNKTTITYTYKPTKDGPTVKAVYTLTIVKNTPAKRFGTNGDGKEDASEDITYSSALPTTIKGDTPAAWANKNQYGAYLLKSDSPTYFKADKTTKLSEADYRQLNAQDTFVAVYDFVLDTAHYQTTIKIADPADPTKTVDAPVPTTGALTVTYTIQPLALPDEGSKTESRTIDYKSSFTVPSLPANATRPNFKQRANNPILSVVSRPTAAKPSAGQTFQTSDVPNFEAGSIFSVTYEFEKVSNNYTAKNYAYVYTYTVEAIKVSPPASGILDAIEKEFGQFDATEPVAPAYTGYTGALRKPSKVTAKSGAPEVTNVRLSPDLDQDVVWSDINKYNPNTEFLATFDYTAQPNYTGVSFTLTRRYKVLTTKVDIPGDQDNTTVNNKDYGAGKDVNTIPKPTPAPGFVIGDPVYYPGNQPTGTPLSPADVANRKPGDVFTVVWVMKLDDKNFSPKDGQKGDSYKVIDRYDPASKTATYTGPTSYPDTPVSYKSPAPSDFPPNALPDPAQGDGYEYDKTEYEVTEAPVGSTPTKGTALPDLSNVNTYPAGTEITAKIYFKAKDGYTSTTPLVITKKLKIGQATGAETGPASGMFANVDIPYGNNGLKYAKPAKAPKEFIGYKEGFLKTAVFTNKADSGNPVSTSVPVVWGDVDTYGAGTVITVTWSFEPDMNYANTSSFDVIQTYTIQPLQAVGAASQEPDAPYEYGTEAPDMPTAANVPNKGTGYTGTIDSIKITKQSTVSGDATTRPGTGTDVTSWAATKAFNALTEFTVTWNYVAKANYKGNPFQVTKKYIVNKKALTAAPPATLVKQTFEYSKYSGTTAPTPPAYFGYRGTYTSTIVKTAAGASPAAGQPADWTKVNTYGATTVMVVTYTYTIPTDSNYQPGPNAPASVTTTQEYEITREKVIVPDNKTEAPDTTTYKFGDDPTPLRPTAQDDKYVLSIPDTKYYKGTPPNTSPVPPGDINKLGDGEVFTVVWTYKLNSPNHTPNDPAKDSYTVTKSYTIAAKPTSYNGKTVYDPATTPYGAGLPNDFIQNKLPDGDANNNFYERNSTVTYVIDTVAPSDSTGRKSGDPVQQSDIATLNAGTKITARFTFSAKSNYVGTPPTVTATKILEIIKAVAVVPTQTDSFLPTVTTRYGTAFPIPTLAGLTDADKQKFPGYKVSRFGNANITTFPSLRPGELGTPIPAANTSMSNSEWARTSTYWVDTEIEVIWVYALDTDNYQSATASIQVKQKYNILPIEIDVPSSSTLPRNDTAYRPRADLSTITKPSPATNFALTNTEYFDSEDGTGAAIDENGVKAKNVNEIFSVKWTFSIINRNYVAKTGAIVKSYTVTQAFKVVPVASYAGRPDYPAQSIAYGSKTPVTIPNKLPVDDPDNWGYKLGTTTYEIFQESNDGLTKKGPISDLSQIHTYGAGTGIAISLIFVPKPGYAGNNFTAVLSVGIDRAAVRTPDQSKRTLPAANIKKGFTELRRPFPEYIDYYEGFRGISLKSVYLKQLPTPPNNFPDASWFNRDLVGGNDVAQYPNFQAGTVLEITWNYSFDGRNYTLPPGESTTFIATQLYTIVD